MVPPLRSGMLFDVDSNDRDREIMSPLDDKIEGPLKIFLDKFGEYVAADDSMQFYSNRKKAGHDTYLSADFHHAEKMSLVVVEEYGIRPQT
jgi:hypothetical protein